MCGMFMIIDVGRSGRRSGFYLFWLTRKVSYAAAL